MTCPTPLYASQAHWQARLRQAPFFRHSVATMLAATQSVSGFPELLSNWPLNRKKKALTMHWQSMRRSDTWAN